MNFKPLFYPQSIAIIGASSRPNTVGNDLIKNLANSQYQGKVYPVNPKINELYGLKVYSSASELPHAVDLAIISLRSQMVLGVAEEIARKGCQVILVISSGFKEVGNAEVENKLIDICQRYGVILLGPNCLGVINPEIQLNASFAPTMPDAGKIAFISQSGALGAAFLDYAKNNLIKFSKFISIGNKAAVNEIDLIRYFQEDPQTKIICVYSEALSDAKSYIEYSKKLKGKNFKPVIILKAGKSEKGSQAASSHTGSLAAADILYDSLFEQCGFIRAKSSQELLELAQVFANSDLSPKKMEKVAIISNAGGPAVLATDQLIEEGLKLTEISSSTKLALQKFLPAAASVNNPIDVLGDASAEIYKDSIEILVNDNDIDAVLVLLTPQSMTDSLEITEQIIALKNLFAKPVFFSFMGGKKIEEANKKLLEHGFLSHAFPEQAARSMGAVAKFKQWQLEIDDQKNILYPVDKDRVSAILQLAKTEGRKTFNESEASDIFKAYGFKMPKTALVTSPEEAESVLNEFGSPSVMKIVAKNILHKSDVGGISIGVTAENAQVKFLEILERVKRNKIDAQIDGVLIEEMYVGGTEAIMGISKSQLGTALMFGMGGIYVEILKDVSFVFLPANRNDLEKMIHRLKISKIFAGARGQSVINEELIIECLSRMAQLANDFPEIKEVDINPLLIKADELKIFDSRIVLE